MTSFQDIFQFSRKGNKSQKFRSGEWKTRYYTGMTFSIKNFAKEIWPCDMGVIVDGHLSAMTCEIFSLCCDEALQLHSRIETSHIVFLIV